MKIKTVWPGGDVDLPGTGPEEIAGQEMPDPLEGPYKPSGEKLPDWFDGYLAKTKKGEFST